MLTEKYVSSAKISKKCYKITVNAKKNETAFAELIMSQAEQLSTEQKQKSKMRFLPSST